MGALIHDITDYRVLHLTLEDPREISLEFVEELTMALERAEDLTAPTVLLLSVIGQQTSTAVSIWPGRIQVSHINKWERLLRRIERTDVITIVSVVGRCSWLILELLLVSDRRLGARNLLISSSQVRQEVWPSMAVYRLSRQIGERATCKLLLMSKDIDLDTAIRFNVVDDQLSEAISEIDSLREYLRSAPIRDFAVRRRLIHDSLSLSYDEALGIHLAACDRILRRGKNNNVQQMKEAQRSILSEPTGVPVKP
jgi:isomerase DpgB